MLADKVYKRSLSTVVVDPQKVVIGLALMVGAVLRLALNNHPFVTSDHAELAAIVTFFYPRNLAAFGFGEGSIWPLLTNAHGILPPLIAMVSSTVLGLLGVNLNEFWWNLPFVLIQLGAIWLAAEFVTRLVDRTSGAIGAVLLALMPIYAALSRASGLSHIPLTFACQLLTIFCFVRYFRQPTPLHARRAGLALALNLLVELFFPLLFGLLLGIGVLLVETRRSSLALRVQRARQLLFVPRLMLLPLLVVVFNFGLLLAYINGWTDGGGMTVRLLEGSDRKPGLYLRDFWDNASYVVGAGPLVLLFVLGACNLRSLWRLEARAVPLLWSIVYLAPFLAFTRPHVYEYFLLGLAPLTLNAAIVIRGWWQAARSLRSIATLSGLVLAVLFGLRATSMIFGFDSGALVGTGKAPGAVLPDQGLKAAAWWIRTNTEPNALVFGDSIFEPYQMIYYTHHPFLAVTDAERPEDAYALLDTATAQPAVYLVKPGNEALLRKYTPDAPALAAVVEVAGQPVLLVYSATGKPVQRIDAAVANDQFDAEFGTWRAMFALGGE